MPIAGNVQNAFFLRLDGDRLVQIGRHMVPRSIIVSDVDEAHRKLLSGKAIYLLAYSDNLAKIKELCERNNGHQKRD